VNTQGAVTAGLPEDGVELNITDMEIESWDFFDPADPGCDGSEWCWEDCPYDALYVVKGPLGDLTKAPGGGVSSDEDGENCHTWAMTHPGKKRKLPTSTQLDPPAPTPDPEPLNPCQDTWPRSAGTFGT